VSSNQTFTVTARPSDISEAERGRRLALVYELLLAKAQERRQRLEQLGKDASRRVCTRCGGDAFLEGEVWRCWNCGLTEPDRGKLRASFYELAAELGGQVVET
jgi:ribosomal protein S27AE